MVQTICDLKAELKAKGIKGYSGKKKAELIAMLGKTPVSAPVKKAPASKPAPLSASGSARRVKAKDTEAGKVSKAYNWVMSELKVKEAKDNFGKSIVKAVDEDNKLFDAINGPRGDTRRESVKWGEKAQGLFRDMEKAQRYEGQMNFIRLRVRQALIKVSKTPERGQTYFINNPSKSSLRKWEGPYDNPANLDTFLYDIRGAISSAYHH